MKQKITPPKRKLPARKKSHRRLLRDAIRFLPAIILLVSAYSVHSMPLQNRTRPTSRVLSYSTSMNISDLINGTNAQRGSNSVAALSLNDFLNNAAQTKANDMVTRNYWSHTTPDGEEPWTFVSNAGYQYKTAGENLAYGFLTGADTITGWMNSPPHRQNLLNSAFTEVGFGFANSASYVGNGQQTVVVAMYGAPLSQASTPAAPPPAAPAAVKPAASAPPAQAKTAAATSQSQNSAPAASEPIQSTPAPSPSSTPPASAPTTANDLNNKPAAVKTAAAQAVPVASTVKVRRIQVLTGGNATWSSALIVASMGAIGVLWALQRGLQFRKLALRGEHFVLQHLHLDLTILCLFVLAAALLQTTGTIK